MYYLQYEGSHVQHHICHIYGLMNLEFLEPYSSIEVGKYENSSRLLTADLTSSVEVGQWSPVVSDPKL